MNKPAARITTLLASLLLVPPLPAVAAVYSNGTATSTFTVTLVIQAGCSITSTPMNFAAVSNLSTAPTATTTLTVTCTNTTPYNVGLSAGTTTGSTTSARLLAGTSGNTATVGFGLFQDTLHTVNWGTAQGTDTVGGTGTGTAQNLTVYGQVPTSAGAIPRPDTYSTTITATVYF
ncbi:spore coat protein U domain-containing protein [Pandoraea sputorum]|uniref:spore coat protein U domain-containing protein n=1 Tax=Pandoraea sputorum TaxID=93222 RepID=UPI00123FE0C2|nr:spore coat protein U domain-containing protein [Pandoraea sputorum]VVE78825.1 spore coat protein U [Pandoraea sputorum]